MKKRIKSLSDLLNMSIHAYELMEDHIDVLEQELYKARRTNFFLFIIGMLFGLAGMMIGLGIGLWTGVL